VNVSPTVVTPTVAFIIVVLVFLGVVLPAVWSRQPDRRCAAAKVLDTILEAAVKLAVVLRAQPGS
jgi:hypothetical protein